MAGLNSSCLILSLSGHMLSSFITIYSYKHQELSFKQFDNIRHPLMDPPYDAHQQIQLNQIFYLLIQDLVNHSIN